MIGPWSNSTFASSLLRKIHSDFMASSAVKLTALSDAQLLQLCNSENPELCPSSFAIKYSGSKFILKAIASVNRTSTISGPAFKETICRCLHFLNFPKQVIDQPLKCDVKDLMQKVGNLCEEGIQYNLPEAFLQRDDVHHKLVRFCSSIGAARRPSRGTVTVTVRVTVTADARRLSD